MRLLAHTAQVTITMNLDIGPVRMPKRVMRSLSAVADVVAAHNFECIGLFVVRTLGVRVRRLARKHLARRG